MLRGRKSKSSIAFATVGVLNRVRTERFIDVLKD